MPLTNPPWQMLVSAVHGDEAALEAALNQIQTTGQNPSLLSDAERLAIWIYSNSLADWHEPVNRGLWTNPSQWIIDFSDLLSSAICKLPVYNKFTYRGFYAADLDNFLLNYYPTKNVLFSGFTSSSANQFEAFGGNVFYIIYSRNGRVLGSYANYPGEEEILFRPATWFRVTQLQLLPGSVRIWLDEVIL